MMVGATATRLNRTTRRTCKREPARPRRRCCPDLDQAFGDDGAEQAEQHEVDVDRSRTLPGLGPNSRLR